jgi:hypothetical protein
MPPPQLKPTQAPIKEYYAALTAYAGHEVSHEGATSSAFQRLLEVTAPKHGWHLAPKQSTVAGGKHIIPDGTLRDDFNLHRGYWEAKDSADKLADEINEKLYLAKESRLLRGEASLCPGVARCKLFKLNGTPKLLSQFFKAQGRE